MALAKFHKQCGKNVAGNLHLFLTDAANVSSVTVTSGEVSDIVMNLNTYFHEIQCDQNTLKRRIAGVRANESFVNYEHLVEFVCSIASTELNVLNDGLDDASPCGILAIVVDHNGQGWLVGWSQAEEAKRPLYLENNDFDSGDTPSGGGNNHRYVLSGKNDEIDLPTNDTINAYIAACIAAGTDIGFTP